MVVVIFLMAVAYTVLLERKLVGRIQNRWGPSRVGPFGLLQPLADGVKLFLKEDLIPEAVYRPLYILAPMIALGCALLSISVIPFGANMSRWHGVDSFSRSPTTTSACWSCSASPRSASTASLSPAGRRTTNTRCSARCALRPRSSATSSPSAFRWSASCLRSGSLRLRDIVDVQAPHGLLSWNFFGGFQFVAFFIYLMAAYAETNRSPFDLPEAESELTAGYHTEYSSMKFAMFFMAEYANMITVGCVATLLFFGGWTSPFGNLLPLRHRTRRHCVLLRLLVRRQGFRFSLSLHLGARHAAALPL